MKIGKHEIGGDNPCYIIAELSANHGHDLQVARETVIKAKESGANAIKLQTYTADTLTIDSDKPHFKIDKGTLWDGRTLYDLYKEAYTPWEWHAELQSLAHEIGLDFFSSPFDHSAVDFLEELDVPCYKIASFEIFDIPLIRYTAEKGKPIIMSTGIAERSDIALAVDTCRAVGNEQIVLLKCTSQYPARAEDANLATIRDLQERFDVVAGLSDHTLGITVPVVATAMGAKVIEKHFILDKSLGGPDADFSLDPAEFSDMVSAVRTAEASIGKVSYALTEKTINNRQFARSLFVVEDVKAGETFTQQNLRSIRPGNGMHPKYYDQVIGQTATRDLERGEPLTADMVAGL